jgi:hypothetical protein
MKPPARLRSIAAWLLLGTGVGAHAAQLEAALTLDQLAERTTERDEGAVARAAGKIPPHEAFLPPPKDRTPEYADKVPPPKIVERPGEAAPRPDAHWIEGYWDWDPTRKEFVWVTGTWRVAPPGKFWVEGFWRHHDEKGWRRVPGFWSERRATPTAGAGAGATRDWRRLGPPPERPLETIGSAPAPDFFYIPGEYVPQGEGVVWRPGFWYRSQPGWEWHPARWVRQATGWTFRDGSWGRVERSPSSPPGNGSFLQRPSLVSTPDGFNTSSNVVNRNPLLPVGAENLSGDAPGATAASPESSGTTAPNGSANGNGDADPAPAVGEAPAATARQEQTAGTTPARGVSPAPAPAPAPYGSQPRYYYPGGGAQWNTAPWGGRFGIGGYLNRFLPF